jgi:hypothetical protein
MNMKEFVTKNRIKINVEWAESNKNMPDHKDANHYKITLKMGNKQLTTYFSHGYGITGEPEADRVLERLASDSAGVENAQSFEDWAADLGYDTDSRKAEKIFHICERQAEKLKNFLGDDLYNVAIYDVQED